jgi:hypothetical protein
MQVRKTALSDRRPRPCGAMRRASPIPGAQTFFMAGTVWASSVGVCTTAYSVGWRTQARDVIEAVPTRRRPACRYRSSIGTASQK